jgi:hypothetical protein
MAGVGFSDGDKGDITISSSGTVLTIDNDAVTYAKIQNVSATDRLLGRSSSGAGDVEEITCTSFGRSLIDDADAATARTTLSVQPTASPAFTGAATFANTGDVVPLTVTNAGTANSFVVNDASGDTSPFVIDASGQVGIGTSAPQRKLHIANDGAEGLEFFVGIFSGESRINAFNRSSSSWNKFSIGCSTLEFFVGSGGTSALAISSTGTATFAGQIVGQAGAAISGGAVTVTSPLRLTGTVAGNNRMLEWQTSGTTRWQVSAHFNAESGSNAGSDLYVSRWSDSGVFLGTPLQIRRDTGMVTCESGLTVQNSPVTVIGGSVSACSVAPSGDPNTGLYFPEANVAAVVTDGVEAVTVNSGQMLLCRKGFALQGEARPSSGAGLEVNYVSASNAATIGAYDRTNNVYKELHLFGSVIDFQIGAGSDMLLNASGELLIGTTSDNGNYKLQVNSQIYATNATIATSDARFKTNVEPLADATSVIESLRPVAFDFIPQADRNFATERQVGLIAQETQAALAGTDYADSVVAQCGDHLGLAYEKLVPVLIKALQESNARIAALEERING